MTTPLSAHLSPAMYLRCYPRDPHAMAAHRDALRRFAVRLGLPSPVIYLDNGCLSTGRRPMLEELTRCVLSGRHRVLLIPGLWVFSVDDVLARRTAGMLSAAGCSRLFVLPGRSRAVPERRSDDSPLRASHEAKQVADAQEF
ncbi:hypothetical protein ACFXKJ_22330 [Kitasatospora indigofera]|uniref:hypothetical protein n=1 Tax=Kitasatospora indigofera TaxID=67307 RepID=UPI0036BAB6A2